MRVEVFDHGAGNLRSLKTALELGGARVRIQRTPAGLLDGDAMVLAGTGAFGSAADRIAPVGHELRVALRSGFPCLAIDLGMQLLMESSAEEPGHGLGVCGGVVRRLPTRRTTHIGWNSVEFRPDPLFDGSRDLLAYFTNSRICVPADGGEEIAWAIHEHVRFAAAIRYSNTWGVQFHPEKSGRVGLRVIGNFLQAVTTPRPASLPS